MWPTVVPLMLGGVLLRSFMHSGVPISDRIVPINITIVSGVPLFFDRNCFLKIISKKCHGKVFLINPSDRASLKQNISVPSLYLS